MAQIAQAITPRGPAADPKYLPSSDPSNPYGFSPQLRAAGSLPPKVTSKYVFFFGYEGSDPHVALQQWFPSPFTAPKNPYEDDNTAMHFPTTEHYMMYHKALLMGDDEVAEKILADAHPSAAKKFGRQVRNFDLEIWQREADGVVEQANWLKFSQNKDLKDMLIGTGDRTIVEASPDDRIWGIGFKTDDAEGKESEWGNNGLGKALMKVRDRLNKGET